MFSFLPKGGRTQPLLWPTMLESKNTQSGISADAPALCGVGATASRGGITPSFGCLGAHSAPLHQA